jgi:hypothetical protein
MRFAPAKRAPFAFKLEERPEAQSGESLRWTERSLRPTAPRSDLAIGRRSRSRESRALRLCPIPADSSVRTASSRATGSFGQLAREPSLSLRRVGLPGRRQHAYALLSGRLTLTFANRPRPLSRINARLEYKSRG